MIVSFCEGRMRLRLKELQNPIVAITVKQYLSDIDGITDIDIKGITGSMLIQYDPDILPTNVLFKQGVELLGKYGITLEIPEGVTL